MSERLSRADWIRQGLRTLAHEGHGALKVGPMSARLEVSRGSFYWHFEDIGAFRAALLAAWRASATDTVIEDLDARQGEAGLLADLMRRAFRGRRLVDRAIRAWGAEDAVVAAAVAEVDARRIGRMAGLLIETGVAEPQASQRATFLYWAYLGQAATHDPAHAALDAEALAQIAALFEG